MMSLIFRSEKIKINEISKYVGMCKTRPLRDETGTFIVEIVNLTIPSLAHIAKNKTDVLASHNARRI